MDETFAPYRDRYEQLIEDPDHLEDVLREGARKVRPRVEAVMARVREAVGMPTRPLRPSAPGELKSPFMPPV